MNSTLNRIGISIFVFSIFLAFISVSADALAAGEFGGRKSEVSLRDTVQATLINNPTVKAFQEYRQAAVFDRERARSGWYPRVNIRAGWGMEQWSDTLTRDDNYSQNEYGWYQRSDASAVITQTIWDGMATWSRYRLTDAMLDSAEHRLFDNSEALSLDAILAHIEVFRQLRLVALSEINVRNHIRMLESQDERQRAGVSSLADVTQTQARLARSESSLADTRLALQMAKTNYRILTGRDPANLETPAAPSSIYPSLENALANSMTSNSKVMAKRADVNSSYMQKELDKSAFHPNVYLEGSSTYRRNIESSTAYAWGNAVQVRVDWNIFNGNYDWYNLKADKARIRQGNRELQALRDNLAEETENTWNQWLNAREQINYYTNAVLYNTQTRDMYLEQFNIGQRSLMDLLDSENELYSSSMQLTTAQLNEIAAQYRLITIGGKLFGYFNIDRDELKIDTAGDDFTGEDLTGTTINNHAFLPE